MQTLLEERLSAIGGLIAFDLTPGEKSICYTYTGSCFRYDNAGRLTELTSGLASPREMPLIRLGAEEKLRRYRSGRPSETGSGLEVVKHVVETGNLHGFMRGSVVIPPDADLTAPVVDDLFASEEGETHR